MSIRASGLPGGIVLDVHFVPSKSYPIKNESHTICCGKCGILHAMEFCRGGITSKNFLRMQKMQQE